MGSLDNLETSQLESQMNKEAKMIELPGRERSLVTFLADSIQNTSATDSNALNA